MSRHPPAVCGAAEALDAGALAARAGRLGRAIASAHPRPRVLGLLADNGIDWLVADLAAERAGVPLVPLPGFFSESQLRHVAQSCGMDALLSADGAKAEALEFVPGAALDGTGLGWFRREAQAVPLPAGCAQITFTSGTTGTPKGVCLGAGQQRLVAAAVARVTRRLGIGRHLCLLPLPVLLENVAGARVALLSGATCCVPALAEAGVHGASGFDPAACLAAIARWEAHSVILLPQMLLGLTAALEAGAPVPPSLRFAAVGGAKIAPSSIARAREAGLPAYEGYGLSECGSVVTLNLPGADRRGSVGRPLPHVGVRIAGDGEILVRGNRFLGYLGAPGAGDGDPWLPTGDLGRVDADGFVHVEGRRRHVLITAFGRNVAPEWPEAELVASGVLSQAAVFGEARPGLCAVVVPRSPELSDAAIEIEIQRTNAGLPDYARLAFWVRADAPFAVADATATANGRVRRDVVWSRYADRLESRYQLRASVG